jgi:hypothetical protein
MITVRSYAQGLAGVRATSPDLELRLVRDPAVADEFVLLVAYPGATDDPADRDVWCDTEHADWTQGRALSFRVKPDDAERLSVSFFDRHRVVYTSWIDLRGGVWQPVRVGFDALRPNPFFQPPEAEIGAPLDLSDVSAFAFAPHHRHPGRLAIGRFVLTE